MLKNNYIDAKQQYDSAKMDYDFALAQYDYKPGNVPNMYGLVEKLNATREAKNAAWEAWQGSSDHGHKESELYPQANVNMLWSCQLGADPDPSEWRNFIDYVDSSNHVDNLMPRP